MADDYTQRPYRPNEPRARGQPAKALGGGSGSDPLAELARLIGQNDPFSEYGRDGVRRAAPPQPPEQPAPAWDAAPAAAGYEPHPMVPESHPSAPSFARQSFGGTPLGFGADPYQPENEVPGYPPARVSSQPSNLAPNYEDVPYNQNNAHLNAEDEDFYDDVPPSRRRMGVLVIAGVFALAVIGTAGAFGYRALFGSSSSSLPPPVIKADSAPSKIVPASAKDTQSSKQITDRINDNGIGEKLVSREEQPVDIKDKPAGVVSPQPQDPPSSSSAPPLGSGIVGTEPKKVRTIAIHPDGAVTADAAPTSQPAQPPARVTNITPAKPAAPAPAPRIASNPPPAAEDAEPAPAPRPAVARVAPPARQAAAEPASNNAPLSLSPDARARPAPARPVAPVARTAAVAPTQLAAASAGAGSYAVQVSSQRSEAEAQAAFRSLQGKYPGQLGGKQPLIRQVDLGDKGIYFRAMVGPFANGSEASELCGSLKAAGGQCIVQRN